MTAETIRPNAIPAKKCAVQVTAISTGAQRPAQSRLKNENVVHRWPKAVRTYAPPATAIHPDTDLQPAIDRTGGRTGVLMSFFDPSDADTPLKVLHS